MEGTCAAGASVIAVAVSLEGELLGGDRTLEGLLLGAAIVGISVDNVGGTEEGNLLGEGDGLLLGALEVGAPAGSVVGTLEGTVLGDGDGDGAEDKEDSGTIEGSGLGGNTGVTVAAAGLSIGATGSVSCRCNLRCLVRGSGASFSFPLVSVWAVLTDNRRFFFCKLSAWQPTTRQLPKITNALNNMVTMIVSLHYSFVGVKVE